MQDPQKAIPRGTLLAIIVTGVTYLSFAVLVGMVVLKESTPFIPSCVNNTYPSLVFPPNTSSLSYCNDTFGLFNPWDRSRVGNSLGSLSALFQNACQTLANGNVSGSDGSAFSCTEGLLNDYQVVSKISVVPYIVTVGGFPVCCVSLCVKQYNPHRMSPPLPSPPLPSSSAFLSPSPSPSSQASLPPRCPLP